MIEDLLDPRKMTLIIVKFIPTRKASRCHLEREREVEAEGRGET